MFLHKQYGALRSLKGEGRDCTGTVLHMYIHIQFKSITIQNSEYKKVLCCIVLYCKCSPKGLLGSGTETQCQGNSLAGNVIYSSL